MRTKCLLMIILCGACAEVGDEPEPPVLPEPAVWRVEPALLGEEAQARQQEVDRYIVDQLYPGYSIVETTQTWTGDLIDWVDPATVPGSQIEPPPPLAAVEAAPGFSLQPTELDLHPELRGPAGTIPFVRPRFERYVEGSEDRSLGDHIARQQAAGQPASYNRLYAGFHKQVNTTALSGYVNQTIGQVEVGSFSLIEMAAYCGGGVNPNATMELVGAVVSRDLASFANSTLRLRVEFLSQGLTMGDKKGGWDGSVTGFVAAAGRPYGPNIALSQSMIGGTQYESHFEIQNYFGNWWIAHNGNWLGYYPGSLFDFIKTSACESLYYGEVYDPTPQTWTFTDMGSGYFSSQGHKWAAHVRNPIYVSGGVSYFLSSAANMLPADGWCYTKSTLLSSAAPWNRYFYLGGPGGDSLFCD